MGLSIKQIEACRRLSRGEKDKDIYPVLEISESSFYKWKKQPAFNKCLEIFTQAELERAAALADAAGAGDEVSQAYADETFIREQLKPIFESYAVLVTEVIERVKEETDDISPRQIPQLLQGLSTLIDSFRTSNDRIAGLENILNELSKLEQERAKKVVSIANAPSNSAA